MPPGVEYFEGALSRRVDKRKLQSTCSCGVKVQFRLGSELGLIRFRCVFPFYCVLFYVKVEWELTSELTTAMGQYMPKQGQLTHTGFCACKLESVGRKRKRQQAMRDKHFIEFLEIFDLPAPS